MPTRIRRNRTSEGGEQKRICSREFLPRRLLAARPRTLAARTRVDNTPFAMETMRGWLRCAAAAALVAAVSAVLLLPASAAEPRSFPSDALADRYRGLVGEIRCLVCQNQNIADSNAELARDLRDKVDEMLRAGRSDEEILTYMVDRYGNFVRYRPPFDAATALLWCGPFVLAAAALAWLFIRIRRRAPTAEGLTEEERRRLSEFMAGGRGSEPVD